MRFSFEQFNDILGVCDATGKPYILIGGQAVFFWASRYVVKEPSLNESRPFTSADIDFQGNREDVYRIMIICTRAFLRETLRGVTAGKLSARGWLGAVERVLKLAESAIGEKAARRFSLDWRRALPEKEIAAGEQRLVVQLREKRLPQWRGKQN